jgi:hypothetical protein
LGDAGGLALVQHAEPSPERVFLRRAVDAAVRLDEVGHLGDEDVEQARFEHEPERLDRRAAAQQAVDLFQEARPRALQDLLALAQDGVVGLFLDAEIKPRGELDRPDHAHRVLTEADVGVPDGADHPLVQVGQPAHVVDQREVADVVEKPVDREIAAERVFLGRAERVVGADQDVFRVGVLPGSERL